MPINHRNLNASLTVSTESSSLFVFGPFIDSEYLSHLAFSASPNGATYDSDALTVRIFTSASRPRTVAEALDGLSLYQGSSFTPPQRPNVTTSVDIALCLVTEPNDRYLSVVVTNAHAVTTVVTLLSLFAPSLK